MGVELNTNKIQNILNIVNTISNKKIVTNENERKFIDGTIAELKNNMVFRIGDYAFLSRTFLTSVSFPACTNIGSGAFQDCTKLATVSFPECTNIGSNAFASCYFLTAVSFPACTSIGGYAFYSCTSLATVSFPACTTISNGAFYSCAFTSISFPVCERIGNSAFCYCTKLSSIYLGASTVCTLSNSNAFYSTSIGSTTGSIYVPSSLVASYKATTNWKYFSNRIYSYAFS